MPRGVLPIAVHESTRLNLWPWKDGYRKTLGILEDGDVAQLNRITMVSVRFSFSHGKATSISDEQMVSIFDAIASELPKLSAVHVALETTPHDVSASAASSIASIPPVQALASLFLNVGSNQLDTVSFKHLRLFADDFDMNAFVESIRIHPRLQNFEMMNCQFSNTAHLPNLQKVVYGHPNIKHVQIAKNVVAGSISSSQLQNGKSSDGVHLEAVSSSSRLRRWSSIIIVFLGIAVATHRTLWLRSDSYQSRVCRGADAISQRLQLSDSYAIATCTERNGKQGKSKSKKQRRGLFRR